MDRRMDRVLQNNLKTPAIAYYWWYAATEQRRQAILITESVRQKQRGTLVPLGKQRGTPIPL